MNIIYAYTCILVSLICLPRYSHWYLFSCGLPCPPYIDPLEEESLSPPALLWAPGVAEKPGQTLLVEGVAVREEAGARVPDLEVGAEGFGFRV